MVLVWTGNQTGTDQKFGSVLPDLKKKCVMLNSSLFSDHTKTSHSSLEFSHWDTLNGGKIKTLASIDLSITYAECFLKS